MGQVESHAAGRAVMQRTIRVRVLVALPLVVLAGFALKFYPGPARCWVNHWGPASVAYEIFFMLLAFLVVPRRGAVTPIAIGVCLATCILEFLQLWQPSWLQTIRSTFLGGAVLGSSFSYWDLPAYPIGCLLGWWLLQRLTRSRKGEIHTPSGGDRGTKSGILRVLANIAGFFGPNLRK